LANATYIEASLQHNSAPSQPEWAWQLYQTLLVGKESTRIAPPQPKTSRPDLFRSAVTKIKEGTMRRKQGGRLRKVGIRAACARSKVVKRLPLL